MLHRITLISLSLAIAAMATGCRTDAGAQETDPPRIVVDQLLPQMEMDSLNSAGWRERVGDRLGLWVSAARQQLIGIEAGRVRFIYTCSTAEKGVGNRENSNQTPLGWHFIDERIGEGMPWGAIFTSRRYNGEDWKPGEETTKDYVLTRIMWLRGLESGKNVGEGIDSHDRFIYIHGTPAEEKLGQPASMGCIRLSNNDVISLFDTTRTGTRVFITEW